MARGNRHRRAGSSSRRSRLARVVVGIAFGISLVLLASRRLGIDESAREKQAEVPSRPERLVVRVLGSRPHDPAAYTQGLLWHDGKLYESTGHYGRSTLRRVDPATGRVEAQVSLPTHLFGEGLARVGERLIQLTWREGVALVWDPAALEELERFRYRGEGWGLCHDGRYLVMSDGSSTLSIRDPVSFEERRRVEVTLGEDPMARLNELECVEGWVYANVYTTESIVRIELDTGRVTAVIDASGLLAPDEAVGADVLNGIAYDPGREVFLVTGKNWPKLFEVRFVAAARRDRT